MSKAGFEIVSPWFPEKPVSQKGGKNKEETSQKTF